MKVKELYTVLTVAFLALNSQLFLTSLFGNIDFVSSFTHKGYLKTAN
ncbi:MAG: hypothetical protein QM653_07260 [Dysgonomonas sp.]